MPPEVRKKATGNGEDPLRVALISFKAVPVYAVQLANALHRITDLKFFVADTVANQYSRFLHPKIDLHPFPTRRFRNPDGLRVSREIIRSVRAQKCRVAHLTMQEPWFNVCIPFIRSFPLITTVHDVQWHPGDRRSNIVPQRVADLAAKHSRHVIVHGNRLKDDLCRTFRRDPDEVSVIPHGNYSLYLHWDRPGIGEETNNILFFGSIWRYKGLEYLIRAEPYLAEALDRFRITIAGVGEDLAPYRRLMVREWNYEILNTFIPDEKVAELFRKASVVVLPYIEASQSGVAPLALSFGKPVVVTNVGSIPELIENGKTGFVVEPADSAGLARAILAILTDPALRKRMGEEAITKATTELSWERIADLHLDAYWRTAREFRPT